MKIGRLLRLKRKVGMKKNEKTMINQLMAGFKCKTITCMNTIAARMPIIKKKCGSLFVSISSLFISRNFSSLVIVMISYFLTMMGIPTNKKISKNNIAKALPTSPAMDQKKDNTRAKRTFQRLISVFKNDGETFLMLVSNGCCLVKTFMIFSYYISIEVLSFIISHLQRLNKEFVKILLTFVVFLSLSFSAFARAPEHKLDVLLESKITKLIKQTERKYNIPGGLLASIAKVESGSHPFAINVQGRAHFARDIEDAKEYILSYLKKGIKNIDVGVMQINLRWHEKEFENLGHMLSLDANIEYAGKLLSSLARSNGGDWHKAVRYYHSSAPEHYRKYSKKVVSTWIASI